MRLFILSVFATILLSSCGGKLIYFQQKKESNNTFSSIAVSTSPTVKDHVIVKGDVLQVLLFSNDPSLISIFNTNILDEGSAIKGYRVESTGMIFIPFVGSINVLNQTVHDAENLIRDSLSNYVNAPNMALNLVAFEVTVLGAVKAPGPVLVPSDKASILEVLALTGDLASSGSPRNVKVIRDSANIKAGSYLDLTDIDVFKHRYYYLTSNDIVYVQTRKSQFVRENLTYVSLLATLLNTAALISLRLR